MIFQPSYDYNYVMLLVMKSLNPLKLLGFFGILFDFNTNSELSLFSMGLYTNYPKDLYNGYINIKSTDNYIFLQLSLSI